jgi:4-hydroxybenzoate polyprenyltransferase
MPPLLQLLRPRQWVKNFWLLPALLFAERLDDGNAWMRLGLAMIAYILLSGAVYAFNDTYDRESDAKHPKKRLRPVASGKVSPATALSLSAITAILGLGLSAMLSMPFLICAASYLLLQLLYCLWLKHEVILDVFCLAGGFLLRAVAGALAINVTISPWLLVCGSLLALFLGFNKRRAEMYLLKSGSASHRRSLDEYSPELLEAIITLIASATVVAYSLYAFSAHGQWMMLTLPLVLYGVLRYLYLSHQKGLAGAPEEALLADRPMQICVVLWTISSALILEFSKK